MMRVERRTHGWRCRQIISGVPFERVSLPRVCVCVCTRVQGMYVDASGISLKLKSGDLAPYKGVARRLSSNKVAIMRIRKSYMEVYMESWITQGSHLMISASIGKPDYCFYTARAAAVRMEILNNVRRALCYSAVKPRSVTNICGCNCVYSARRQFAFSIRGCRKSLSIWLAELIFINFPTHGYGIAKDIHLSLRWSRVRKDLQGSNSSAEGIDTGILLLSPSDSLPGRFAFRSLVFAGSINIYIA